MRSRLRQASSGTTFSFICDQQVAGRMERVILFNDGKTVDKQPGPAGTLFTVMKV